MTNPDYRAMCAEMLVLAEESISYRAQVSEAVDLIDRARAALAQPEPQGPTVIGPEWQPCVKLPITVHVREQRPGETHSSTREGITPLRPDDLIMRGVQGEEYPIGRELFNQTYRMGAARRPEPEPVALTGWALEDLRSIELLLKEHKMVACTFNIRRALEALPNDRARALLAEPVAVGERLPEQEDCIFPTGECWWFDPHADGAWYIDSYQGNYTHWLPANALPTPEATNE